MATAALSPADIAAPIRRIFRHQPNVAVMLAEATGVDVAGKRVILADGSVDVNDTLIVATARPTPISVMTTGPSIRRA